MPTLSVTIVHKVGLSLQARSMLGLTKYVVKLHISRNKGNLVGLDLGKQLEKMERWTLPLYSFLGFGKQPNKQEPGWCLFNLLGL